MYFLRQLRARRLERVLLDQRDFYEEDWTSARIRQWQLDRFNEQWQVIGRSVPYFQSLRWERDLPEWFSTWEEFKESMPIMVRKTVQDNAQALTSRERKPDYWRTTGGSTAEPLHIPTWGCERQVTTKDLWYARSWFGVMPSDKLFLIWGHSHLLGSGVRGWLNGNSRRLKDALLGYYRYSAYDLSEKSLREAGEALVEFKPCYIIAYAVALDRFARLNRRYQTAFHALGLKVAIATAESFPRSDSADFVSEVFGCPVVMEYGAVETGPIAHQKPDGRYSVFWRHYYLEGLESKDVPGAHEVLVTSLYPRCLPLVRYRLGDLISANADDRHFMQKFETVIGRCNDLVALPDGGVVHSEAFAHVVKDIPSILDFQVVQTTHGEISLNYAAKEPLSPTAIAEIRRRLAKVSRQLEGIRIHRVSSPEQTIAGKGRRIIREC